MWGRLSCGSWEDDVDVGDYEGIGEQGLASYMAFDQIDKAPEEKERG